MRIHVYIIGAIISLSASAIGSATAFGTGRPLILWQFCILGAGVILIRHIIKRWTPRLSYASTIFEASAIFLLSWKPILIICYAAQALNAPLYDDYYRSLDLLVGFDGAAVIDRMSKYPALCTTMSIVYNMFFPSMFIVMLFGGWFGSAHKIAERSAISIMIAFLITAGLSSLFPAYGYGAFISPDLVRTVAIGATPVAQLDALRDGSMRILNNVEGGGIITFPSMHWGLAIILLGTTFRLRWLFLMMVPISLGLMATALVQGAHYLADAIAGAMVGGLSIIVTDWFLRLPAMTALERALYEAVHRVAAVIRRRNGIKVETRQFGTVNFHPMPRLPSITNRLQSS